jgi:purine-binding chemotaxis protein CheW
MSASQNISSHSEATETNASEEILQLAAMHLADEVYGIDIACIHTVITPQAITPVPKTPSFVKGVINLRGRVVPVIDLRDRFGLPPAPEEKNRSKRIVIVEIEGVQAGLIVDAVSEVVRIPASAVTPPSRLVASEESRCVTGIGRITVGQRETDFNKRKNGSDKREVMEERLVLLLDVASTVTGSADPTIAAESLIGLQKAA